ncbi:YihY/virulence factor BrkB family protein [Haloprofundus salinisoli]|uniref:YihY/virulence factor BrkB family protein n=1 Tax=Haloprofundus salinisoli TaxID=2876193 RepID=UPI001CCA3AD2|nr:YihY/virulence factor BrkB family protein [Haloprofundus salinisoli]
MIPHLSTVRATLTNVVAEFRSKNVAFMAGSIAYNAFVSLLPLLLLLVLSVSVVGSAALERRVIELAATYLAPGVGETLREVLREANDNTGFSLVGIVVLLWGTLKIFRGLDTAFAEIYETEDTDEFVDQLRDGLVVFVALLVAVVAMITTGSAFAALAQRLAIGVLNPLFLVVALSIAFFPLYYIFPNADLSIRDVVPGLVTAAAGWAALQALFQVYVAASAKTDAYGVLGGIVLLVTWLYFAGLLLLLGAVINAVVGGYVGDGVDDGSGPEQADLFDVIDARGVGNAAPHRTHRKTRLTPDETATYLDRFREDLTDRYRGMRPTDGERSHRSPAAATEIGLLERSYETDGDPVYETCFRWRVPERESEIDADATADTPGTADTADPGEADESAPADARRAEEN